VTVGALVLPPTELLGGTEESGCVVLLFTDGMRLGQVSGIDYSDNRVRIQYVHYREYYEGHRRLNVWYQPIDKGAADYEIELVLKNREDTAIYTERRSMCGPRSDQSSLNPRGRRPFVSHVRKAKFFLPEQYDLSGLTTILKLHT
jgi:hypothetical protein